ncbi:MAG: prepilin peptidase [Alphaproteobacteria bacterium]|nr:prepilin peptidase [Alphaproteobacteria bacterium]
MLLSLSQASWPSAAAALYAAMPDGLPEGSVWLALVVLALLLTAAVIDAFKGIVPDPIIFFGTLLVVVTQGFYVTWPFAAHNLTLGLAGCFAIWAINEAWYRFLKHDALGMGDAKWTMLAITAFSIKAALIAWGAGACFAVLWLIGCRIICRKTAHVHFAPFLFIGLLGAIFYPLLLA